MALVSKGQLLDANGKLQSTNWLSLSIGPSLGGVIVATLSAVGTLVIDAISYLASAIAVWRIRTAEPTPPARSAHTSRRTELTEGMRFVFGHPVLKPMLISWVVFAGCIGLTTPVSTVFYLRDLSFEPWQYGILMGVPSLGGFLGARFTL